MRFLLPIAAPWFGPMTWWVVFGLALIVFGIAVMFVVLMGRMNDDPPDLLL